MDAKKPEEMDGQDKQQRPSEVAPHLFEQGHEQIGRHIMQGGRAQDFGQENVDRRKQGNDQHRRPDRRDRPIEKHIRALGILPVAQRFELDQAPEQGRRTQGYHNRGEEPGRAENLQRRGLLPLVHTGHIGTKGYERIQHRRSPVPGSAHNYS